MRRTDYFPPGGYHSLPDVIMAMEDLSSEAKLVWMALAKYLSTKSGQVYPSVPTLMTATGLARTRVMLSTRELERHGLCRIERGKGRRGVNIYHLLQPQARLFQPLDPPRDQSQGATSRKARPVAGRDQSQGATSRAPLDGRAATESHKPVCDKELRDKQSQGATSRKARHEVGTEEVDRRTPLPPAGGCVGEAKKNGGTTTATEEADPAAARPTEEEVVESALAAVAAAYASAMGGSALTPSWRRRIRRETREDYASGLALAGVTAGDLRAAIKLCEDKGRTMGLGWVRQALSLRLRREAASAEKRRASEAGRRLEEEQARTCRAEATAIREHWEALPGERQESYRAAARRNVQGLVGARLACESPLALAEARRLAWADRPRETMEEAVMSGRG